MNNNINYILQKDNNNLDLIRIVCASLVIIGHSYKMDPHIGQEDIIKSLTGFTYSAALAVKIFFFISGMLVTDSLLKKRSIPAFLISRFFRIVPALFFILVISAIIVGPIVTSLSLRAYFLNVATYKYIYLNLSFFTNYLLPGVFTTNPWAGFVNGSLWTLRIEIKCYLLLLFIFIFIGTKKTLYNIIIAIVFIGTIFHLRYISINGNSELSLLPFSFALGMLMAVNKDYFKINYMALLISLILTIIFWRIYYVNEIMFIVSSCILVILLCKNKYVLKIKIKHDISYGIYLWGFIVQQTIYHFAGSQNIYIYNVECLLVAVICGYISFVLVERKFMEIGRELSKKITISEGSLLGRLSKSR